jgi:hypothetical protein
MLEELRSGREQEALQHFEKRHSDPDDLRGSTETPLCEATSYAFVERVSLLLRAGADSTGDAIVAIRSAWTPLAAAMTGNTWGGLSQELILRDLLSHGVDVNRGAPLAPTKRAMRRIAPHTVDDGGGRLL